MKSPDITPAQIGALLTVAVGQLVAWDWLSTADSQLVVAIGSIVIGAVWKIADAVIRHGRAHAAAAIETSAIQIEQATRAAG